MKINSTLKLATTAMTLGLTATANAWVGYSLDVENYTWQNPSNGYAFQTDPLSNLAQDGWTNRFSENLTGTNYTWAPDGLASAGATGGVIADGGSAGFGQAGSADNYINFFANYASENEVGPATTQLERTIAVTGDNNGDYRFSFDIRGSQELSATTGGTYGPDGDVTIGVFAEIWGGEYWWYIGRDEKVLNVTDNWSTQFIDFAVDVGGDNTACNWQSNGCNQIRLGFYNIQTDNAGADRDTGVYIDNLAVTAVPVPAAAWLFGSALAGLLVARRNK